MGDGRPYLWINEAEVGDTKTFEAILKREHIAFTAESSLPILLISSIPKK
jgi:hypothetical protein